MLSLPAIGFTYLLARLLSFLFDINFDSAITHGVLLVLAAIWTLATINSKEGSEELLQHVNVEALTDQLS